MTTPNRRHLTLAPQLEGRAMDRSGLALGADGLGADGLGADALGADALDADGLETVVRLGEQRDKEDAVDAEDLLQVGELAKATGKTVRAIHLYEDLGLIEPARRSKGRYRLFAPEAKVRVRWISKLQSLGLSLTDIQAIVLRRQSSESARRAASELGDVYRSKLEEVRKLMREYRALESELEASLGFLDTCSSRCESELSSVCCSQCTKHPADAPDNAPDLVLGARIA
jgi:DNA-binding transcriptional MerR regulator